MVVSLSPSLCHVGPFDSSSHLVFICVFIAASVNLKCKNDLGVSERRDAALAAQCQMMLYTESV